MYGINRAMIDRSTVDYTLRQLKYFVAVAEHGTIVGAAEQLHLSESAVSSAVADLESALGVALMTRRKSQGVLVTPSGRFVLERARRLLREADLLHHDAAGDRGELVGPVLIGCSPGLAPSMLPSILDQTATLHPRIALDFVLGAQDDLIPRLLYGEIDVVVLPGRHLPAGVEARTLFHSPVVALLPADHRLRDAESVNLRELAHEPYIMLDVSPGVANAVAMFANVGKQPLIRYRSNSVELTKSLVAKGLGFSLLLRRPWPELAEGHVEVLTKVVEPQLTDETIAVAWSAAMPLGARAQAVLAIMQQLWAPGET
jgi:DNA-binding transcriptional LysR family regulator